MLIYRFFAKKMFFKSRGEKGILACGLEDQMKNLAKRKKHRFAHDEIMMAVGSTASSMLVFIIFLNDVLAQRFQKRIIVFFLTMAYL